MAQLITLFLLFAQAQTLELLSQQTFGSEIKFKDVLLGGLSGLHYKNNALWAISDDRGSHGPYRMYKFDLEGSMDNRKWSVKPVEMIPLGDVSGVKTMDTESIYLFDDGKFLISSEGDLNRKPREMPMIRFWSSEKKWENEISLPKEIYPEKVGMQTKGITNNGGFEAVAVHQNGQKIWFMPEFPLVQRSKGEIDLFEYELKNKKWKKSKKYTYKRDKYKGKGTEVLRGMSEALWWKEDHLLVLERSLIMQPTDLRKLSVDVFSAKMAGGKVEKKKILTLKDDLGANWEGMSWGPDLPDGKRLLILVSDNNFTDKNDTRFLFYSFKE